MIEFNYQKTGLISTQVIKAGLSQLEPEIAQMRSALKDQYDSSYASLYCPFDEKLIMQIKQLVTVKRKLKPSLLVVVGIGGSNLGTQAVLHALGLRAIEVVFIDTVDPDKLHVIMMKIDKLLDSGKEILINAVSKSGTTTETVANFKILYSLIKAYRPKTFRDFIIVTTGKDSKLAQIATEEKFDMLAVPENVGGRYSVFSAIGLFPLVLAGVDVDRLLFGARSAVEKSLNDNGSTAASSAVLIYENWKKGSVIHSFFFFATRLEFVGKWYRQLMGESIGKQNQQGDAVGIIPMTSVGSVDLHSVAQLYLAGPHNIYTSFVIVKEFEHHIKVPKVFPKLDFVIDGKYLTDIMHAISEGTQQAYSERSNPYGTYTIPSLNAESIGSFMQIQMIQMMFLGKLLQVNPFNQPDVELYKTRTRKILKNS
ncbi:hypothetical protein HOM50_03530 [bacterium]|jgi:glucose-6-phosphate isomerase|nr:hypothetical protein [bacterium]MBT5015449.1 hypothetical protein [bacterium]